MKHTINIAAIVIALLLLQSPSRAEEPVKRYDVFYLNSYHDGYPWSNNLTRGIRDGFAKTDDIVQLQIEYLNSKKYYDPTIKENLFRHFRYKFRNKQFDAVIVSDNNALEFMLEYGDSLMPGLPVIFAGINDFKQYNISPGKKITGIIESIFFKENLELARRFHPHVEKMIVIGNNSVTSIAIMDQIKESIRLNGIKFDIQFRYDLRSKDLITSLKTETKPTMLYIIPAYEEIDGEFYSSWELTQKVYDATGLPVYGSWEFLLGYGVVGGKVTSAYIHGLTAAELALRTLAGEDASTIPYVRESDHKFIFDYNILQRFNIPKNQLPVESVYINEPYNFYKLHRTIFWFIVVSVILLILIIVLLVFNTNQRKHANIAMRESKTKLRMILDNVPHLVFWQDLDLRFMDVNQSFMEFFNIKNEKTVIGSNDYSLLGEGIDVDLVSKTNHEVMKSDNPKYRIRWAVRRPNQDEIWLEVNKIPFHDEMGNVVGVLSTAEDVTKKVNLEKQLRQSQKMEALGLLSGGIAHDFNNILTSIINSAELAIEDVPIGSMTRKDLKRILNASARGSNLVKQILTFSRPSHQEFRPLNMVQVLTDSLELIKTSKPENIDVIEDIQNVAIFCMGNPTQVHQIIMNLVTNSFQAMQETGGLVEIGLKECYVNPNQAEQLNISPGAYTRLTASDTGPGIDNTIMDKIFDPFFTTKSKNIGTGLGLSVVHGIVQGHNGAITVSSLKNERTEFRIYFPQMEEEMSDRSQVDTSLHFGHENILFVEDDADQRASVPRALETLGYKVVSAENADDALDKFKTHTLSFDLIITDYDMPRTNGLNLAKQIQSISPETPVIMISGRQFEYSKKEYVNIKRLVSKPYDKITISGAVRQVMNEVQVQ